MHEWRDIVILKYDKQLSDKITQEYVLRYQVHNIDWDMRYYRENAFGGFYPDGSIEYLRTRGHDLFARAQYSFAMPGNSTLLTAVESTTFYYGGDTEHYSNTDLNDEGNFEMEDGTFVPPYEGWFAPFPENEMREMGPWFEYIKNKPVNNIGAFLQYSTGNLLGNKLRFTGGVRYDTEFFNYTDIKDESRPLKSKTFNELSPRAALIIFPTRRSTLKIMAGKAFRAPAPSEMFGSNTWTLASNIEELKPETILTAEIALEHRLSHHIAARINTFYTQSKGLIAYSIGNYNLSTNIYDLTNTGVEAEILFTYKNLSGFVNGSYTHKIDEAIYEPELPTVSMHKNRLTWAPQTTANFGITHAINSFSYSILGHYQGEVLRRDLDLFTQEELSLMNTDSPPRPDELAPWISFDANIRYKIKFIKLGLSVTNILDTDNPLVKNLKYPFDYHSIGRRIMLNASFEL